MRHPCPQCGRKYDLRSWQLGEVVECPNCQTRFILEEHPTWTPEEGPAPLQQTVLPPAETSPNHFEDMSDESPDWAELDPHFEKREDLARQVRLMMAAGKSIPEIQSWLEQSGLPAADIETILFELTQSERKDKWAGRCGKIGALVGCLLSVTATIVYRPWTVTWVNPSTGLETNPIVSVGVYWCGGLLAFTFILWFLGSIFGGVIDYIRDRRQM